MGTYTYERIAPDGRCVSPDGHDYVETVSLNSPIPDGTFCPRCGGSWTVLVFEEG